MLKQNTGAWWVEGDFPPRLAETLLPLVDGRAVMLAMSVAFLQAKSRIWLAGWDVWAHLPLVRDEDQRAGPNGSADQNSLEHRLRQAGLDATAIAFWTHSRMRLVDILSLAVRRGVDVRVLLWSPFNPGGVVHLVNDPARQQRQLARAGIHCRLDKNSRAPWHAAQSLHQKTAVVDAEIAFVGGVDITVQRDGDFDRWDTPAHPLESGMRSTERGPAVHPWHDSHVLLRGPAAQDVAKNFEQRWSESGRKWQWLGLPLPPLEALAQEVSERSHGAGPDSVSRSKIDNEEVAGGSVDGQGARVQVVRTIPALTYRFAPAGIRGIVHAYRSAIRAARKFIYMESQYLWLEGFHGLDIPRLGWQSRHMKDLLRDIAAAAERGVTVAIVLPDHPNVGRRYTDAGIDWIRRHAPAANAAGRLHFFCLTTCSLDPSGFTRYAPIYVHSKASIVDDAWSTVGSANLNSRGMSHDAELNLSIFDAQFSRGLRLSLWAEHLGCLGSVSAGWPASAALPLPPFLDGAAASAQRGPEANLERVAIPGALELEDPLHGLSLMAAQATRNLRQLQARLPLAGQVFPYVTCQEGANFNLDVDPERGVLDPLRAQREGIQIPHHNAYT